MLHQIIGSLSMPFRKCPRSDVVKQRYPGVTLQVGAVQKYSGPDHLEGFLSAAKRDMDLGDDVHFREVMTCANCTLHTLQHAVVSL